MKQFLVEMINEGNSEQNGKIASTFENYLQKQISNFSGQDCAVLALTMSWFEYKHLAILLIL